MTYSEQLEREAEQTRLRLAGTLDELRASLSPGQMVDHLVSYTSDGAGQEFLHNLKRQTVDNPLPVTLIGAGLAWLMMSSAGYRSHATSHRLDEVAEGMSQHGGPASSGLADAAEGAVHRVRDAASSAGSTLSGAMASTRDATMSTYDAAARTAATAGHSAGEASRRAAHAGKNLAEFASEQPLILAGIGLALGAALGAMLPRTDAEDELMGRTADEVKDRAQDVAAETYEKAAAVGERAFEAATEAGKEEAERQGLTPESLKARTPSADGEAREAELFGEPRQDTTADGQSRRDAASTDRGSEATLIPDIHEDDSVLSERKAREETHNFL